MTNSSNGGQTDRLTHIQKKQILLELAQAVPLKEIAVQYRTDVRTVQRVRLWALKKLGFRSSLDQKVQDYLTDWERARSKKSLSSPKTVLSNSTNQVTVFNEKHFEELSKCAKRLVKTLETFIGLPKEYTIEDEITVYKDFENLKFFENKTTRGLFAHLAQCEDFPQLKKLDNWNNLSISDINEVFLALISLKAASGEFKGECDICRAKPDANTKVA